MPACISQTTPPCIPFSKVFLEGHTSGMDADTAPDSATPTINVDVPSVLFAVGRPDTYECIDADENGVQSWRKCNITSIGQTDVVVVVDILRPRRKDSATSTINVDVPSENDQKLGGLQTEELTWRVAWWYV